MKSLFTFIILLSFLISCSNEVVVKETTETESFTEHYTQKWKLVKMTGDMINSETTGNDMAWQEYYIFNSNSSFFRSRTRDGVTTEISGTFKYERGKDANQTDFLTLTYPTESTLIGNCTGDLTETLMFTIDKKLSGTWNYCDGPGLIYEWIE